MPVFALAPGNPDIFILTFPTDKEVVAGSSVTFTITVVSQEGFEDMVQMTLDNPPMGILASFYPNPVEVLGFDQEESIMIVNITSDVPDGEIVLTVTGMGVAQTDVIRSAYVVLKIVPKTQTYTTTVTTTRTTIATTYRTLTTTLTATTTTTSSTTRTLTSTSTATSTTTLTSNVFTTRTATVTNTERTTETYSTFLTSTKTISTVFISTSTAISSVLVGVQEGNNLWSYSTIGIGITLAGLFVAISILKRKSS